MPYDLPAAGGNPSMTTKEASSLLREPWSVKDIAERHGKDMASRWVDSRGLFARQVGRL